MMNARLAQFYGLPDAGLPRDEFQRVSLPADSHRGGLLTQAAILSLTSDGTRHRPVHRGVWVSEAIFGQIAAAAAGQCRSDRDQPRDRAQGDAADEAGSAHPRRPLRRLPRQDRSARAGV